MEKLIALKHKLDAIKTMGTNAKKEALANLDEFEQSMVSLMLNPFIRFGVKKYKVAEPLDTSVPSDQKVVDLLEKLAARELTGNIAIAAVESLVASMCADGQDVFRRFLLKDPKAGVGISLCNKVFENPIPKFEVQLASPYKEKGDKYPFRGARRIRKKSYAKVFRASVRAETSRLPVCGSAARRNRRLG